jgi:hypothetical protein
VNPEQAKEVLLLYRPGTADAEDPQVQQAIELAQRDLELGRWFQNHCHFQEVMRAKFREIEAPAHLKAALIAQRKIVPLEPWWRNPIWLTAAAAMFLLLLWLPFRPRLAVPDHFANYREMMVSIALKNYRMDWTTNDQHGLRQLLAAKGAPANYDVPRGLEQLKLTGGAALTWRNHPVSMVCFDRGNKQMLFLFVMPRAGLKDPPDSPEPELTKVSSYLTATWTRGENTYVLAGPAEQDFLKKYGL